MCEQFSNSIITEKEGTILSAHCLGCKAGLAESCSHVSSVLFYLEAWTKINGRLSCMLAKRLWLLSTYINQVEYEKVPEINLTLVRKMGNDSDVEIENLCCSLKLFLSLLEAGFFTSSCFLYLALHFAATSLWSVQSVTFCVPKAMLESSQHKVLCPKQNDFRTHSLFLRSLWLWHHGLSLKSIALFFTQIVIVPLRLDL